MRDHKFLVVASFLPFFLLFFLTPAGNTEPASSSSVVLKRGKRYLDFIPKSRMFFRANVKDNVIKVNTLWAHAFGYRANYPIENDKKYRPFRRDVYDTIEDLLSRHGLDGQACTLKTFCTAIQMVESQSGMIFKLFKLIFTLEEGELVHFPHFQERFCKAVEYNCPLSFRDISPYTDEI